MTLRLPSVTITWTHPAGVEEGGQGEQSGVNRCGPAWVGLFSCTVKDGTFLVGVIA